MGRRVLSLEKAFVRWATGQWSTPKLYRWCMRHYGEEGWKKLVEMEEEFRRALRGGRK